MCLCKTAEVLTIPLFPVTFLLVTPATGAVRDDSAGRAEFICCVSKVDSVALTAKS